MDFLNLILATKMFGGGGKAKTQEKTVTIDVNNKTVEIVPDDGYAISKVTANVSVPPESDEMFAKYVMGSLYDLVIPSNITSIRSNAFRNAPIGSVVIHSGVTWLGDGIFVGCTNLKTAVIPASVRYLQQETFYMCRSLTDVSIQEGIEAIQTRCFASCQALKEIVIPSTVTSLALEAFYNCKLLEKITILGEINYVGDTVFGGCYALTDVIAPSGFKANKAAFSSCSSLQSVTLKESSSIGEEAFYGCTKLTNLENYDSVTAIGERAFYYCTAFNLPIPSNVKSIGREAFVYSGITEAVIPSSVTSIGYRPFGNTQLKRLVYNSDLSIPDMMCAGLKTLESIEINGNITSIGSNAFESGGYDSDLIGDIVIPASVTSIGSYAFYQVVCQSITFLSEEPPTLGTNALSSGNINKLFYVPDASIDKYKSATNWSSYASRIVPISSKES